MFTWGDDFLCRPAWSVISIVSESIYSTQFPNSQAGSETDSMTSGEGVDGEDESKMLKGRQFVYKELVATEADYVRDLECVINVSELAPGSLCWSGRFTHCALYPSLCQNNMFICCSICELPCPLPLPKTTYTHTFVSLLNPSLCRLPCTLTSQSYYDEMDPKNLSIPLRLRGKRDVVFGNLLDIFKFHDQWVHVSNMACVCHTLYPIPCLYMAPMCNVSLQTVPGSSGAVCQLSWESGRMFFATCKSRFL